MWDFVTAIRCLQRAKIRAAILIEAVRLRPDDRQGGGHGSLFVVAPLS
jgi:hypothetical protein